MAAVARAFVNMRRFISSSLRLGSNWFLGFLPWPPNRWPPWQGTSMPGAAGRGFSSALARVQATRYIPNMAGCINYPPNLFVPKAIRGRKPIFCARFDSRRQRLRPCRRRSLPRPGCVHRQHKENVVASSLVRESRVSLRESREIPIACKRNDGANASIDVAGPFHRQSSLL